MRVLTGANIPPGADAVVMVEQTEETDGLVSVRSSVKRGSNILRRGEDARKGAILLQKGALLGPAPIGICAAVGRARVKVHRRPRVTLLCTGEELRDVGDKVGPHEIRISNGPLLSAALSQWGYGGVAYRSVPDDPRLLRNRLRRAAATYDVILLTGGVSVGPYDFVQEAVARIGAIVRFHGVAMKPGKPLLYATLPGNRHIFGLPGSPLSAMTGFHEFALPALRRLSGSPVEECRPLFYVPLASPLTSKGGRVRFVMARLQRERSGLRAVPVKSHSSADLVAGGRADGVIAVPPDVRRINAGALVEFRPWRPLP